MILEQIISSLWFILPAYFANAAPVFVKLITKTHPIDGGRLFFDKKPITGKGKTIEGFLFAIIIGVIIGLIQSKYNYLVPTAEIKMTITLSFLLAFGAIFGDFLASFLKRRLGFKRGESVFLLDQLDFVIIAILFATIIVITPLANLVSNVLAYTLKLKDVWW